jgi:hypothetical protein
VRRRVSDSEWFTILDIPDTLLQSLTAEERRRIIADTSYLPLEIITKLIDSFPSTDVERPCIDSSQPSKKVCLRLERAPLFQETEVTKSPLSADRVARNSKATKNDDAQVPVYLWDEAIVPDGDPLKLAALNIIRTFALCWWMRHTTREFLEWTAKKYPSPSKIPVEYRKDRSAGLDCLSRCANSSWREWSAGSHPLFWRWPEEYKISIHDGVKLWSKGPLPDYKCHNGERKMSPPERLSKASLKL